VEDGVYTRGVRQACETKLRTLRLPDPFTIDAFSTTLAVERGRPIRLVPLPTAADAPCGLWLSTPEADYVMHQTVTSRLHQEHIVLHELAHIIFDHKALRSAADVRALLPDLHPQMVTTVLARSPYTSEQEQQAEVLADLIAVRARRRHVPAAECVPWIGRAVDVFGPAG
jgi:hypothetical protein